jgi:hypothetical protein
VIWLGSRRGYLSDWITQRWVQFTGRKVSLASEKWLDGPLAPPTGIGPDYFQSWANRECLTISPPTETAGILARFDMLRGSTFNPAQVHADVAAFYEETASYELDAWAEWCGFFRPFGWLLAFLFSRRLQQLNVPLSGLDTSRGMTNEVLPFVDPETGSVRYAAWFRRLRGSGDILYAGFYSVCHVPGHPDPCVKVVFPLPNGNAIVVMRAESRPDRSFVVTSAGDRFGDPGFYFTVDAGDGFVWARYVKALRESITVFPDENGSLRADHILHFFGITFLRLHYRMRRRMAQSLRVTRDAKT